MEAWGYATNACCGAADEAYESESEEESVLLFSPSAMVISHFSLGRRYAEVCVS